jgi:hypothetical protein
MSELHRWSLSSIALILAIERLADVIRELEAQQQARAERRPEPPATVSQPVPPVVPQPVPQPVVPQPVQQPVVPQPVPQPAATPQPQYFAPMRPAPGARTSPPDWVGTVMVVVPIVTCGFLAFVPSIWVAVMRRGHRAAMVRSLVVAAAFLAVDVVALIAVGTAPKDAEGTATGTAASVAIALVLVSAVVAAVLAVFQRNPTKGDEPR